MRKAAARQDAKRAARKEAARTARAAELDARERDAARTRNLIAAMRRRNRSARAAREAECSETTYLKAFPLPDVARSFLHKRCTRQHATQATRAMFPMRAESCIEAAFARCFNDHVPFREQPQQVEEAVAMAGEGKADRR